MAKGFKKNGQFVPTGNTQLNGRTFSAWDVKAKSNTIIVNPQMTELKNGRPAIRGESQKTGIKVHRILSNSEAEELKMK